MTQEQLLDFESFIDVMVQIYKLTSDKIGYSNLPKNTGGLPAMTEEEIRQRNESGVPSWMQ